MQIKEGEDYELPRIIVDKETALRYSGLSNPYAKAKALSSFEMAMRVAGLSREGTWRVKERDRYLTILASSHELMRQAALLADRAREIEKANDTVLRTPHLKNGSTKRKVKLMDTLS
jgi:methylenetetrahydromethanopterin dehydrogenase